MTSRASRPIRQPKPDHDSVAVRYRQGPEPGDRVALVDALARLLVGLAERDEERASADVGGVGHDQAVDQDQDT